MRRRVPLRVLWKVGGRPRDGASYRCRRQPRTGQACLQGGSGGRSEARGGGLKARERVLVPQEPAQSHLVVCACSRADANRVDGAVDVRTAVQADARHV